MVRDPVVLPLHRPPHSRIEHDYRFDHQSVSSSEVSRTITGDSPDLVISDIVLSSSADETPPLHTPETPPLSPSSDAQVGTSDILPPHYFTLLEIIQPGVTESEFAAVQDRVNQHASLNRTDEDAVEWSLEYFISDTASVSTTESTRLADVAASDLELYRCHGSSITRLAQHRFNSKVTSRLNSSRVRQVTDKLRLLAELTLQGGVIPSLVPIDWNRFLLDIEIACQFGDLGVPILTPPGFKPSGASGPPSRRLTIIRSAVNAHVLHDHSMGSWFILPLSEIQDEQVHLQNFGIAPKYGKKKGRLTCNCSGVAARPQQRYTPLNSSWVVEEAIRLWGPIQHPTLPDIVRQLWDHAIMVGWINVVAFKDDLLGFFTLLSFLSRHVPLMGFQLFSPDSPLRATYAAFATSGNFGSSEMPFALEVITRLIRAGTNVQISGRLLMYVDDIIVISSKDFWERDRAVIRAFVRALLGPTAIAEDKADSTDRPHNPDNRSLDVLGWNIDLSTRMVSVAYKNQVRALHWFLEAGMASHLTLHVKERLCSLAERYSTVFTELRILMPDMYLLLGGKHRILPENRVPSPPRSRLAILLWQVFLLASEVDRGRALPMGRPMSAFLSGPSDILIEFDGSLDGIGWRIFNVLSGTWISAAYMVVPSTHLPRRDPTYQNTMELTALSMALVHVFQLGFHACTVSFQGDSETVLCWSARERFPSQFAISCAAVFIATHSFADFRIGSATHIKGETNIVCDRLSRGDPAGALAAGDCGGDPHNFTALHPYTSLLTLCKPVSAPSTFLEFVGLWSTLRHILVSIQMTNLLPPSV